MGRFSHAGRRMMMSGVSVCWGEEGGEEGSGCGGGDCVCACVGRERRVYSAVHKVFSAVADLGLTS